VNAGPSHATLIVLSGPDAGRIVVVGEAGLVVGRDETAALVADDPAVSRRHARIAAGPRGGYYVQDLGSTNGTFVAGRRVAWAPLGSGDTVRLGPDFRLRFAITDESERSLQDKIYESSVRDSLTRAYTRRYATDRISREIERSRRTGGDTAVLLIDVDNLKRLNDERGHLAGDRALCATAAIVAGSIRAGDVLGRYGGDEFVVLLPNASGHQAVLLARRIRTAVAKQHFAAGGSRVPVTVSIGVASLAELRTTASPMTDLIALADGRLYEAKRSGRNGVSASKQVEHDVRLATADPPRELGASSGLADAARLRSG
jgi:two-component system cell cycle response regulator